MFFHSSSSVLIFLHVIACTFKVLRLPFCRHILRPDLLIIQYVEFTTLLGQPINQLIEKKKKIMLLRIIKMRFVLLTNVVIIYLIIS